MALSIPNTVNIFVQNKFFYVSIDLLRKHEPNYFVPMLPGNWADKSNEFIFVDRDPKIFKHVLDFLRGYPIDVEYPSNTFDRLYIDANFYAFSELVKALDEMKAHADENSKIPKEYHDLSLDDMIQKITNHKNYDEIASKDFKEPTSRHDAYNVIKSLEEISDNREIRTLQIYASLIFQRVRSYLEEKEDIIFNLSPKEIDDITSAIARIMFKFNLHSETQLDEKNLVVSLYPILREIVSKMFAERKRSRSENQE